MELELELELELEPELELELVEPVEQEYCTSRYFGVPGTNKT